MKKIASFLIVLGLCSSAPLVAAPIANGPDLQVTLSTPSTAGVYQTRRYTFNVQNVGNRTAAGSKLVIELQRTGTSPEVYVLGTVIGYSTRCTKAANLLTCSLGDLAKNASLSVFVDLNLPYAVAPIVVKAAASTTTSGEINSNNNLINYTTNLRTFPVTMTYGTPIVHQHCTGSSTLTSFFECTLFPSSIAEHEVIFAANNTLTIPAAPTYTGSWVYTAIENRLQFEYFNGATRTVVFDGRGVGGNCFEGLAQFPTSTSGSVALYRICFPMP